MSAEIPRLIQQESLEAARRQLDWYYEVFGADNFFLELQEHDIEEIERIIKTVLNLGKRSQARFVATNDVHYINPEDARLQDILLAIQTGCVLSDPNRMRMIDQSFYLRCPEEVAAIFTEGAPAPGIRTGRHPPDGVRHLFLDRVGSVPVCAGTRHLVQRTRISRRFDRGLYTEYNSGRPVTPWADLRTIPYPGAPLDSRYPPGLPRRQAGRDVGIHC